MSSPIRAGAVICAVAALLAIIVPRGDAVSVRDAPGCPGSGQMPERANVDSTRWAILCLLNRERARHGLQPLTPNPLLDLASQRHSDDMVARRFFEHDTPEGVPPEQRIVAAGYAGEGVWVGENIYAGAGPDATPVRAASHWMKSPGHRENILRPQFTEVGVGISYDAPWDIGDRRGATYTTDFGGPDVR